MSEHREISPLYAEFGEFDVAKLAVEAGDVLIFKFHHKLTPELGALVQKSVKATLPPGVGALVIDVDTDVSVMRRADIELKS